MTLVDQEVRIRKLAQRFRERAKEERSRLAALADDLAGGNVDGLLELRELAHRLAGTAGLFGFRDLSSTAQMLDDLLTARCTDNALIQKHLAVLIARMDQVVRTT